MTQIIAVVDNKRIFNVSKFEKEFNCTFLFDVYIGYQAGEEWNCYFVSKELINTNNKILWWQYDYNLYRSHKQGNIWVTNIETVIDVNKVNRINHCIAGNYAPKLADMLEFEYNFNKPYGLVESK